MLRHCLYVRARHTFVSSHLAIPPLKLRHGTMLSICRTVHHAQTASKLAAVERTLNTLRNG